MSVAARPGVPFDLKSTAFQGLALVLRSADMAVLTAAMTERFGLEPGVFGHDPVAIDLSVLPAEADGGAEVDFIALNALLRRHHLQPAGVRGGSEALRRAAFEVGLGDLAEEPTAGVPPLARTDSSSAPAAATAPSATEPLPPSAAIRRSNDTPPAASAPADEPAAAGAPAGPSAPTLIVDKPLRSGQQVYAKGGDLVVLATVNVGAEVIADGSIHVYGPLRGKAVAGAKGDVRARIFSTCMEPQLLAIAGTYRTTENPLPADVVGKPAQIRLDGERLVFEPLA